MKTSLPDTGMLKRLTTMGLSVMLGLLLLSAGGHAQAPGRSDNGAPVLSSDAGAGNDREGAVADEYPTPYPTPPLFPCGPNPVENQGWRGPVASGFLGMLAGLVAPACAKGVRQPPSLVVCKPLLPMDAEEAMVLSDTLQGITTHYPNILARSAYYGVVHRLFNRSYNRGTVGIQFFDAARRVTDPGGVGSIERPPGWIIFPPPSFGWGALTNNQDAIDVLEIINADLFQHNMRIIARVARFGCPLDPLITDRNVKVDPMRFDLNMVLSEQNFVGQELRRFQADPRYMALANLANAIADINHDINLDSWDARSIGNLTGFFGWPDRTAINWAKNVLGGPIDFRNYSNRVAIGRALIFKLHGRSEAMFRTYWARFGTAAEI